MSLVPAASEVLLKKGDTSGTNIKRKAIEEKEGPTKSAKRSTSEVIPHMGSPKLS